MNSILFSSPQYTNLFIATISAIINSIIGRNHIENTRESNAIIKNIIVANVEYTNTPLRNIFIV